MAKFRYGVGTVIYSNATFSDPDDETVPLDVETGKSLLDPTTVTCSVRAPGGTVTTYTFGLDDELTRLSEGKYRLTFPLTPVGTHKWTWTGATVTRAVVFYGEADAY